MQKAFDWVNKDFLWCKLFVHNITGKIYWAVRSIYNYNESCVKVNTLLSELFKLSVGVRQGDNLSPTLFGIFINDLAITHFSTSIWLWGFLFLRISVASFVRISYRMG